MLRSTTTDVAETALFARMSRPGTQVLAYRMTYSAKVPTAMILPLPVALPAPEDPPRNPENDYARIPGSTAPT